MKNKQERKYNINKFKGVNFSIDNKRYFNLKNTKKRKKII